MHFRASAIRFGIFASAVGVLNALTVTVTPSMPDPVPVGTAVTWTASAGSPGQVLYRFRIRSLPDRQYRIVQDYGPSETLSWAAADHDGTYEIEVSARDVKSGETAVAAVAYAVSSRIGASRGPIISATAHPLTFLYSAPPCPEGSRMRVNIVSPELNGYATPYKDCVSGLSMNFYLSGMRAGAVYLVHHTTDGPTGAATGPDLTLAVPDSGQPLPGYTVLEWPAGPMPSGVLLHSPVFLPPVATDLEGNVVWFYPSNLSLLTRPVPGGTFWGILQDYRLGPEGQILREFDLAGITIRETNAGRVNEQLAAMGFGPIGAFHHDALSVPGGNVLALASNERTLTDVQGPGPVNVIGDMILLLDRDMQVVWAWDAFDHLDPRRPATLGEICGPGAPGCPPFYASTQANDWLHGNSLQFLPDGNILYSARHQDWVIKIEYPSGRVLWRLGKDGDFDIDAAVPDPWFSHQHDPEFQPDGTLAVFDNGNVRNSADPYANSRGQVYTIDEENRRAGLLLNSDLGWYSFALGSAQRLPGGGYHFDLGWLPDGTAWSVELDGSGNIVYCMQSTVPDYRSFRMASLYGP